MTDKPRFKDRFCGIFRSSGSSKAQAQNSQKHQGQPMHHGPEVDTEASDDRTRPWFRRIWTLQKGVIPKNMLFCTPERYMTPCSTFLQMVGIVEVIASAMLDAGAMEGVVLMQELQEPELYKILKPRQLYANE
ncbi:hypothetical protein BDW59DRAFT_162073 [Aspergillus cavernicola]|uniref:Phosphorylase b kinase regulatory subunit n=1 Tax=Aspergillus cavernicola TaxID=176166 RepID=A0ABR4IDD7_9EURO